MIYEKGTLVRSLAGHDKDEIFIIIYEEKEYVSLVDGKTRTLSKSKRKNKKHIQIIHDSQEKQRKALLKEQITDVQIKKFIQCYKRESQS